MKEKGFPGRFGDSNNCILEGFADRPENCPNNPWKHPENFRPGVCDNCPTNPEAWQVSKIPLPKPWIELKQRKSPIKLVPRQTSSSEESIA